MSGAVVAFPTAHVWCWVQLWVSQLQSIVFCLCARNNCAFLYCKTCRLNVGFDRWGTQQDKHTRNHRHNNPRIVFCFSAYSSCGFPNCNTCMHVNVSCGFPNYNTHILVFTYIMALWRKLTSLEVLSIQTCGRCC